MRLQAIRVYSARGACRVDAGIFTFFTGKLHVTQVNGVWGFFTCELQVKLPAFAGNFARASFTVYKTPFKFPLQIPKWTVRFSNFHILSSLRPTEIYFFHR